MIQREEYFLFKFHSNWLTIIETIRLNLWTLNSSCSKFSTVNVMFAIWSSMETITLDGRCTRFRCTAPSSCSRHRWPSPTPSSSRTIVWELVRHKASSLFLSTRPYLCNFHKKILNLLHFSLVDHSTLPFPLDRLFALLDTSIGRSAGERLSIGAEERRITYICQYIEK